ncbi:MAG: hypothetical protein ACRCZJ_02025 [Erysipelotrichaceae bacterium]
MNKTTKGWLLFYLIVIGMSLFDLRLILQGLQDTSLQGLYQLLQSSSIQFSFVGRFCLAILQLPTANLLVWLASAMHPLHYLLLLFGFYLWYQSILEEEIQFAKPAMYWLLSEVLLVGGIGMLVYVGMRSSEIQILFLYLSGIVIFGIVLFIVCFVLVIQAFATLKKTNKSAIIGQ